MQRVFCICGFVFYVCCYIWVCVKCSDCACVFHGISHTLMYLWQPTTKKFSTTYINFLFLKLLMRSHTLSSHNTPPPKYLASHCTIFLNFIQQNSAIHGNLTSEQSPFVLPLPSTALQRDRERCSLVLRPSFKS